MEEKEREARSQTILPSPFFPSSLPLPLSLSSRKEVVGLVGGWGRRRSRERGIDLQWVRMSAGIDSAAVQRARGRRNRNTGVPGCRRGLARPVTPGGTTPLRGRGEGGGLGWLAGWLVGRGWWWSSARRRGLMSSTRRLHGHTGGTQREGGRERERVQRTGANFRLALSGFTRSAFRTEGKKRRSELADRAVAKLKDLLKNPTDYWSQFGE